MADKEDNQNEFKLSKKKRFWQGKKFRAGFRGLMYGAALLTAYNSYYIVDETEQAVVTRIGNPVQVALNHGPVNERDKIIDNMKEKYEKQGISVKVGSGVNLKIPFIDRVTYYDRRLLRWNGIPDNIPTKDKKFIWLDPTARWYIQDPLLFLESLRTEEAGQSKLDENIGKAIKNNIPLNNLIEIVRTDNRKMEVAEEELKETTKVGRVINGRVKIVEDIYESSKRTSEEIGIGFPSHGILIKGLSYVDKVKENVENNMIAERKRISEKYLSQGKGEYNNIMGKKDREVDTISSVAYRESQRIMGEADGLAVKIYAEGYTDKRKDVDGKEIKIKVEGYNADPEFYRFTRTLDLYKSGIGKGTKMLLGTDNPLLYLLKGDTKKKVEKK